MKMRPLVSIIVANYNYSRYFPRFFQALERQTLGLCAVEIVFVDDGSTDGSLEKIAHWKRKLPACGFEVIKIRHTGKPGLVRNAGSKRAGAEYLLYLDPDDLVAPDFLAECLTGLHDAGADLAYTDWMCCGPGEPYVIVSPEYDPGLLATQNFFPLPTLMRRKVWEKSTGFAENTAYEDWDFWVQAAHNGFSASRIPRPLYYHMVHGDNFSYQARQKDGPAKAMIVLNNKYFFDAAVVSWAKGLLRGEPWAVAFKRGLIPRARDVSELRRIEARVLGGKKEPRP